MGVIPHHHYWSRPAGAAVVGLVYFVLASAAAGLTRFEGGVACLWIANAMLLAVIMGLPARKWRLPILACAVASMVSTTLFGIGIVGAIPFALINMLEVVVAGAVMARRGVKEALGSLPQLGLFLLAAGIVGPAVTTWPAAGMAALLTGTPFWSNAINWFLAHALGALTFTPICDMVVTGDAGRWLARGSGRRMLEAALLFGLVIIVAIFVFSQNEMPILFLPILPVILATFRLGRLGTAMSVMLLALIGGALTARGMGPVYLARGDAPGHIQFLQFYLAVTVLTALPVAADLARRDKLYEQLRDSEERFRLITEHSTDIVMTLQPDGLIRYVSPSVLQLGGYQPDALRGRTALELVVAEDRNRVRAAHARALASAGRTISVEYRARTADGSTRWFESNARAMIDPDDGLVGMVSAIRDIGHRKSIEAELSLAATTDPLTGLANRRAFDVAFDRCIAGRRGGCIALFDLDHFKLINDNYGHAAGDRVIQAFAVTARRFVREGDMVARLGGEEFGILLPGLDGLDAWDVCERIRVAVSDLSFDLAAPMPVSITVSAGIAVFSSSSRCAMVLDAADAALYAAKHAGRNLLMMAD